MVEAVAEELPTEEAAAPPKNRLLIYIAIGALVLLGGGGAAFYFMQAKPEVPVAKGQKAGTKEAAAKGPALYTSLDPAFVVNFEAQQVVRFLQITVQIMTRDAATQTFIKEHDPVIRNDLLLLFGSQKYEDVATREGKEHLRVEALETVRKVIAAEGGKPQLVEAIYFTSLVMQ